MRVAFVFHHVPGSPAGRLQAIASNVGIRAVGGERELYLLDWPQHTLIVLQAVQFGVARPADGEALLCLRVWYARERTLLDIARWAYSRAKSVGADYVVFLHRLTNFTFAGLRADIQALPPGRDTLIYE